MKALTFLDLFRGCGGFTLGMIRSGLRCLAASAIAPPRFQLQLRPAKYVFRCPVCDKKFERSKYDAALRPHKDKNGHACSGRIGYYETTKH